MAPKHSKSSRPHDNAAGPTARRRWPRFTSGGLNAGAGVGRLGLFQETLTITGHSSGVYSVSFSPDGKRIVSGSRDNTLKVWDISSLDTSK